MYLREQVEEWRGETSALNFAIEQNYDLPCIEI